MAQNRVREELNTAQFGWFHIKAILVAGIGCVTSDCRAVHVCLLQSRSAGERNPALYMQVHYIPVLASPRVTLWQRTVLVTAKPQVQTPLVEHPVAQVSEALC